MFDQFVGFTLNTSALFEIAGTCSPDLLNSGVLILFQGLLSL